MQAGRRKRNRAALILAVLALAVLDSASGDSADTTSTTATVAIPGTPPTTAALSSTSTTPSTTAAATTAPVVTEEPSNTQTYHVVSVVTLSDTIGVGNEAEATWTLVFGCDDGRCDAEVRNGGPLGTSPLFVVTYRPDTEDFTLAETGAKPNDANCPDFDLAWEIVPSEWNDRGPVTFTYTLQTVLQCEDGEVRVDWDGEGVRN